MAGEVRGEAIKIDRVSRHIEGRELKKVIFVQDKILNFIVD